MSLYLDNFRGIQTFQPKETKHVYQTIVEKKYVVIVFGLEIWIIFKQSYCKNRVHHESNFSLKWYWCAIKNDVLGRIFIYFSFSVLRILLAKIVFS